jgi:hypothetical protein
MTRVGTNSVQSHGREEGGPDRVRRRGPHRIQHLLERFSDGVEHRGRGVPLGVVDHVLVERRGDLGAFRGRHAEPHPVQAGLAVAGFADEAEGQAREDIGFHG